MRRNKLGIFPSTSLRIAGNTSGTSASIFSGPLVFAGGNNVTLSQNSNTITISAAAGGGGGAFTGGMSNLGNTSGTSGLVSNQIVFAGGNNVTLSQSVNGQSATVTISAFNQTSQSNTFGMSNLGNTSGTSGVVSGPGVQFAFAGGNNITLSQSINGSSATITVSAFNQTSQSNTFGMSNLGNTSGTSGVISGPGMQMVLAGGNNVTLSQSINGSSATVTISAGAGGGAAPTLSYWDNFIGGNSAQPAMGGAAFTGAHRSLYVQNLHGYGAFPGDITANTAYLNISISGSTATMSAAFTSHFFCGVYTINASSLSLLNSVSVSFGTGAAATNNSTFFVGPRFLSIHSSQWSSQPVFRFGSQYHFAYFWSSAGALNQTGSILGQFQYSSNQRSGTIGTSGTGTSQGMGPFYGVYSATTGAFPTSIGSNQLNKVDSIAALRPHVIFNNAIQTF